MDCLHMGKANSRENAAWEKYAKQQRWADCRILGSRSSTEFLKLSPSPPIVQKVEEIQNPSPNIFQKIKEIQRFDDKKYAILFH